MGGVRSAAAIVAIALLAVSRGVLEAADPIRIGGTGAGLAAMRLLGTALNESGSDIATIVMPSLGSSGGIQALMEGALDLAVSSRPLKPTEAARGLREVACLRSPFVLATSSATAPSLARSDLVRLFTDPAASWPDGTPMRIVLRMRDDSDNFYLTDAIPGMAEALQTARMRPDLPIAATDQDNAGLLQEMTGSLGTTTLIQIRTEGVKLTPVPLDGVAPTLE